MAIAYSNSTQANVSASNTLTFSHTISGSDRVLFVDLYWNASRTVSSVTYNGVAMTAVVSPLDTTGGERHGMYYLIAPATGTNNVVVTLSNTADIVGIASSYTGVDQTSPIDTTRTEIGLETGTTYAEAITNTTVDNCWAIWGTREYAGRTITAGANTALRQRELVIYGMVVADSGGPITPAGAYTMNLNAGGGSGNWYSDIIVTFKPSGGGGGPVLTYSTSMMMGV